MKRKISRKRINSRKKNTLRRTQKKRRRNTSKRIRTKKRTLNIKYKRYSRKKIRGGELSGLDTKYRKVDEFLNGSTIQSIHVKHLAETNKFAVEEDGNSIRYTLTVVIKKGEKESTCDIYRRYSELKDIKRSISSELWGQFPGGLWKLLTGSAIQERARKLNMFFAEYNKYLEDPHVPPPDFLNPGATQASNPGIARREAENLLQALKDVPRGALEAQEQQSSSSRQIPSSSPENEKIYLLILREALNNLKLSKLIEHAESMTTPEAKKMGYQVSQEDIDKSSTTGDLIDLIMGGTKGRLKTFNQKLSGMSLPELRKAADYDFEIGEDVIATATTKNDLIEMILKKTNSTDLSYITEAIEKGKQYEPIILMSDMPREKLISIAEGYGITPEKPDVNNSDIIKLILEKLNMELETINQELSGKSLSELIKAANYDFDFGEDVIKTATNKNDLIEMILTKEKNRLIEYLR